MTLKQKLSQRQREIKDRPLPDAIDATNRNLRNAGLPAIWEGINQMTDGEME
ncbi:hypothetical protein [Litorimonas sp.]|uniref:hypothetical protein n=1 Tax=Litorimonas sp. TaxID=1892381 RepID=UPI003A840300